MNQEIENEREWRRHIVSEMQDIKKNQQEILMTITSLKLKIGAISAVFGAIASWVFSVTSGHK
jgi:hypothetical protein